MANDIKKYVGPDSLSAILNNIESTYSQKAHMHSIESIEGLQEAVGAAADSKFYVVTFDQGADGEYHGDLTFAEIREKFEAGGNMVARIDGTDYIPLLSAAPHQIIFSGIYQATSVSLTIDSNDVCTLSSTGLARSTHSHPTASSSASGFMSKEDKVKLNGIETGAEVNIIESITVNGEEVPVTNKAVNINITKANIGLGNVDNTADSSKSVKHATSADSATSSTKATQDGNGKVISSTYETKADASAKLTEAKTYADNAANTVKNDLLNNAGAAYDTLKELGDLIDDNKDAIDALEEIAAGKANATHTHTISDVSNLQSSLNGKANTSHTHTLSDLTDYDDRIENAVLYSEQTLTDAQKEQVQRNIGVVGVVTPQDYGAKGDGSTDDTKAFQDALANNRIVFIPSGTYKLSGELIIGQNCQLKMAQDVLLNFTQTSGNCISMRASSNIVGNHSAIKVPYAFTGKVINIDAALDENIVAVPPFTNWGPMWMAARYITDLHIAKFDEYGVAQSADGDCCGTAVYLRADYTHYMDFLWAVDIERLRVAGAFTYGVHLDCVINPDEPMDGFIHQTKIDAFIAGCEVAVYLKDSTLSYISARIVPQLARSGKAYAKHGIVLENSTDVDLSNSRVMDWEPNHCLWTEGGRYQHLALIGNCAGLILSEHYYYSTPTHDIRSLIYTDTPSNLDKLTILQEPITRWFKPKDGVPYFNDGDFERKLLLQEEFDECFLVDRMPNFEDALPGAIDKDGTPFNNGRGYFPYGYLWEPSAGNLVGEHPYYGCTGLISIKPGDTIYTSALKWKGDGNEGAVVFDSSFNRVISCTGITVHNMTYYFGYDETDEGFALTVNKPTNAAYVAFTFRRELIGNRPTISVNNLPTFSVNGFLADGIEIKSENVYGLDDAIEDALAEAKVSGEFKGDKGDTGATGPAGTSVTVKSVSESTVDGGSNIVTFSDGKTVTIKNGSKGSTGATGPEGPKGDKGDTGASGKDGVSATHSWSGTTLTVTSASGTSSSNLKGDKGDTGATGPKGDTGASGKDGVSATHSWNGTTLTVTSASGTSSSNLKGDKGDKGDTGATGSAGTSVTVKSVSESTDDGGSNVITFSDGKTVTVKNGSKGSTGATGSQGPKGDTGAAGTSVTVKSVSESAADGGSNVVTFSDGKTVTIKNGSKGSTGATGSTGANGVSCTHSWSGTTLSVTSASGTSSANLKGDKGDKGDTGATGATGAQGPKGDTGATGAAGKTPVRGTDYWTEADKADIVRQVLASMAMPVAGIVDENNNIIITGELPDGAYTLRYEFADGSSTRIGTLNISSGPAYTNQISISIDTDGSVYNGVGYKANTYISSSTGAVGSRDGIGVTGFIPIKEGDVIRLKDVGFNYSSANRANNRIATYDANKNFLKFINAFNTYVLVDTCGGVKDANDNWTQFTVVPDGSGTLFASGFAYMRICAEGIGANSIITINEPIE